jgi:hypothetical protein
MNDSDVKYDHADSLLREDVDHLNESLSQHTLRTNLSVMAEQSRAIQVEDRLSDRIAALEAILSPLVDLVTHMIRSARPLFSTAEVAVDSKFSLNLTEGGRVGDRIALINRNQQTKCTSLPPDAGFVLTTGAVVAIPQNYLRMTGTYHLCYAAVASSVSERITFWDQGSNVNVRVVSNDVAHLSPINMSSDLGFVREVSYTFFSNDFVTASSSDRTIGQRYLALVPELSTGCQMAWENRAPIDAATGTVAFAGTNASGNFALCHSLSAAASTASAFRRQNLTLSFAAPSFHVELSFSGFSRVVAGVRARIVLNGGESSIRTISFLHSESVGCTGAVFKQHQVLNSNVVDAVVIGTVPGQQFKVCYSLRASPTADTDFAISGAHVSVIDRAVTSLSPVHALPGEIVVGSQESSLAYAVGAQPGDEIALLSEQTTGCRNASDVKLTVRSDGTVSLPVAFSAHSLGSWKICARTPSASDDEEGDYFYDQNVLFRVITPILGAIVPVAQTKTSVSGAPARLVAGTRAVFSVSKTANISGFLMVALVPTSVNGCENATRTATAVAAQNNTVALDLPVDTKNYTWCVSTRSSSLIGASDDMFLRHSTLPRVELIGSAIRTIECINASSSSITLNSPSRIKMHTTRRLLVSTRSIAFVKESVVGCTGAAQNVVSIIAVHTGYLELTTPSFTDPGRYKICLTESGRATSSDLVDDDFLVQAPTLLVTTPVITVLEVAYADAMTVTRGVPNDMGLQGASLRQRDLVVLVPQTSQGCSGVVNSKSYALNSALKMENVILPYSGTFSVASEDVC